MHPILLQERFILGFIHPRSAMNEEVLCVSRYDTSVYRDKRRTTRSKAKNMINLLSGSTNTVTKESAAEKLLKDPTQYKLLQQVATSCIKQLLQLNKEGKLEELAKEIDMRCTSIRNDGAPTLEPTPTEIEPDHPIKPPLHQDDPSSIQDQLGSKFYHYEGVVAPDAEDEVDGMDISEASQKIYIYPPIYWEIRHYH